MNEVLYNLLVFLLSSLWAMSMGASGFSVSFATLYSTKKLSFITCVLIFTLFLFIGAILLGNEVVKTLSSKVINNNLNQNKWLTVIILFSASTSLLISIIAKVPSSTSIIIMSSFLGVGIYFWSVNWNTFIFFLVFSVTSFILTYFITFFAVKSLYPPNYRNLWFYEKFITKKNIMFFIVLAATIYNSFSIGTNNVANVVGPVASFLHDVNLGFAIFSIFFGIGALLFGKGVLKTVSEEIVPIGIVSATIISITTSSITVIASILGLPFPIVIVISSAVIATSTVKKEISHFYSIKNPITLKIIKLWIFSTLSPAITSFITCNILNKLGIIWETKNYQ